MSETGKRPDFRAFLVEQGKTETDKATFINICGFWSKDEGKFSGKVQLSASKDGVRTPLDKLTLKNGQFVNLHVVK